MNSILSTNSAICAHPLTVVETDELMQRFPKFELSYETIPHKKVSSDYNICVAIPNGRKGYAWFSFYKDQDVCYFMDLNREKRVSRVYIGHATFDRKLCLGTLIYGTFLEEDGHSIFVMEDIFMYRGIPMRNLNFGEKIGFMYEMMERKYVKTGGVSFILPVIWGITSNIDISIYEIPQQWSRKIGYVVHHIQYRCLTDIAPYLNVFNHRNPFVKGKNMGGGEREPIQSSMREPVETLRFDSAILKMDYSKPQYKYPTVFLATADIQYDIYHLFAYGRNKTRMYCGIACIQNFRTSVMMNGIFRKINENQNLDAAEESEDEDEFENVAEDKYVDLQKTALIECVFHKKFRKWMPVKIMRGFQKVVHISQLV